MALASTGLPCALTDNSSTARTRLGDLYGVWDPTYGHQVWRYVQNKSGGSFTQGLGVMQENGTDLYEATLSGAATANARMLGVAQHTISDGYFGFVLADGVGVIKAATIGTDEIPVHAMEAAASGATARAHIRCL
jgi:hypothetical protein